LKESYGSINSDGFIVNIMLTFIWFFYFINVLNVFIAKNIFLREKYFLKFV